MGLLIGLFMGYDIWDYSLDMIYGIIHGIIHGISIYIDDSR